jgi:hypothetical protein
VRREWSGVSWREVRGWKIEVGGLNAAAPLWREGSAESFSALSVRSFTCSSRSLIFRELKEGVTCDV